MVERLQCIQEKDEGVSLDRWMGDSLGRYGSVEGVKKVLLDKGSSGDMGHFRRSFLERLGRKCLC